MTDLHALAKMLGEATGPSRELDKALFPLSHLAEEAGDFDRYWHQGPQVRFTSSIDAAMALAGRLLQGTIVITVRSSEGYAEAAVENVDDGGDSFFGDCAPTAPLAILKAVVAALIAMKEKTGG